MVKFIVLAIGVCALLGGGAFYLLGSFAAWISGDEDDREPFPWLSLIGLLTVIGSLFLK